MDNFINLKEPRFLLDKDSICYGCPNYKEIFDCTTEHCDDDFDRNMGTCDVNGICCAGDKNKNSSDK